MFTVAFDFDGVINDLPIKWTRWLNNQYNLSVDEENLKYYDMSLNFPTLSLNQILEPLNKSEFWDTVDYHSEVNFNEQLTTYKSLTNTRILIVTATSPETWGVKYEHCVKRLLPDFPVENIILTSRKDLIKCDVLVDDHIENLKETSAYKVLVDASYNKNIEPYLYNKRDSFYYITNGLIYSLYHKHKEKSKYVTTCTN